MCKRKDLSKNEYNAFKQLLLMLDIKWEDCKDKNIIQVMKKQHHSLAQEVHPDKNVNATADHKEHCKKRTIEINHANDLLQEFIVEPLEKGLSKRNNLVKALHSKLHSYSLEELQRYLDDNCRKNFSNRNASITRNKQVVETLDNLRGVLVISTLIAFFITNGISCNVPLAVGFFSLLLASAIFGSIMGYIYKKNEKGFNQGIMSRLLNNFDQECNHQGFSESDRTKLKWAKNSFILSNIIVIPFMFYGVGLDLVANGFGVTNSLLLSGLLLMLPFTLFIVASPIALKYTTVNIIEEQFKGDNEKPISDINPDDIFQHNSTREMEA